MLFFKCSFVIVWQWNHYFSQLSFVHQFFAISFPGAGFPRIELLGNNVKTLLKICISMLLRLYLEIRPFQTSKFFVILCCGINCPLKICKLKKGPPDISINSRWTFIQTRNKTLFIVLLAALLKQGASINDVIILDQILDRTLGTQTQC